MFRPIVAVSEQPRERRRGKTIKYGYLVAVLGLAVFIVAAFTGASLQLEGPAARFVGFGALSFMALSFWLGTVMVAVEKGYNALVAIVLGSFSLLGLLVLVLMPDYSDD